MLGLPLDVWAMMLFSVLVFFGVSIWALVRTLRQEEEKMDVLRTEDAIDAYSPPALHDLRAWIRAHPDPDDPEVQRARTAYQECVESLRTSNRHFYDWTDRDIERLETL